MKRQRLIWHLYFTFVLLTLGAISSISWYISGTLYDFHIDQTRESLSDQSRLVVQRVTGQLHPDNADELDRLSKHLGESTGARITLILPDGTVIADSREQPRRMDNHARRPEIVTALNGGAGVSIRFSQTLQQTLMYVALPVYEGDRVSGCVRTALSMTAIERTLDSLHQKITLAGILIALLAAFLSLWLARRISQPLETMRRGAERFALGEFDKRLMVSGAEELAALSTALNDMAAQLNERFETVVRQRNELDAVLASMIEGVVAVDNEERILRLNPAAAHIFGVTQRQATNRPLREVLRKASLQQFISDALSAREPLERDLNLLVDGAERSLQVHGTPLTNARDEQIGALIVIGDITRLRRLESLRRDFVANVSHELKTPITAIRGWAETLQHQDPQAHAQAVEVIIRQADRLNAIFNDLLDLSRLEQEQEHSAVELQPNRLAPLFDAVVAARSTDIAEQQLDIIVRCDPSLQAECNSLLIEQAVTNLFGNAIKYSEPGGQIVLSAQQDNRETIISVRDYGCGIPAEHLPRLFERFYRVDPARSRALGGTGLGLAIVKHIAQIHHGEAAVKSTVGVGSTFSMTLPRL